MLTSLGRTGTHWVKLLLDQHDSILSYRALELEPRALNYWMSVLRALSEPMSYLQSVTAADMDSPHWWLGLGRFDAAAMEGEELEQWLAMSGLASFLQLWSGEADSTVRQWLARDHIEELTAFCQSRVDRFYSQVARTLQRDQPAYFVEKNLPDAFVPAIAWEVYPNARELILIRDLRDVVCSVFAFSAKLGYQENEERAGLIDEEYIRRTRSAAIALLRAWQERGDRAFLLRYEDLMLRPSETLQGVLQYLDVNRDEGCAERMLSAAASTNVAGQAKHRTTENAVASIGRWQRELDPAMQAVCHEAFGDVLEEFGYEMGVAPRG
jgi:hypothetical protein